MKRTALKIMLLSLVLISCGPSVEQKAAQEKRLLDSINNSKEQQIVEEKRKLDSASAAGKQQLLEQQQAEQNDANEAIEQENIKQQIIDLNSRLEAEKERLSDLKLPKLLRTADDKAKQIESQTRIVEELKSEIVNLKKQILN
jgi:hypothetical protein